MRGTRAKPTSFSTKSPGLFIIGLIWLPLKSFCRLFCLRSLFSSSLKGFLSLTDCSLKTRSFLVGWRLVGLPTVGPRLAANHGSGFWVFLQWQLEFSLSLSLSALFSGPGMEHFTISDSRTTTIMEMSSLLGFLAFMCSHIFWALQLHCLYIWNNYCDWR